MLQAANKIPTFEKFVYKNRNLFVLFFYYYYYFA